MAFSLISRASYGSRLKVHQACTKRLTAERLDCRALGSAQLRPLCLLGARLAALGQLWPARCSQGGDCPPGAQPRPGLLARAASKVAASKVADFAAFGPCSYENTKQKLLTLALTLS